MMIVEMLKTIEKSIGIEVVINFLCLICGIGIGGGITDAVYSWKKEDNEAKKWRKDDEERLYKAKNDTYGRGTKKAAKTNTGRKRGNAL